MRLYTIGFTRKSASQFFEALRDAGVKRVVDVRLNNVSQLAGFTKKQDLAYFLEKIDSIGYIHASLLAPTQHLLDSYKKHGGGWSDYERGFLELMKERKIEISWASEMREGDCLLCSEEKPDHCHRRLVAEYLAAHLGSIKVQHLGVLAAGEELPAMRITHSAPVTPLELTMLKEMIPPFVEPSKAFGIVVSENDAGIKGPALWLTPGAIFR
jgi:uncharacterized protein (DUF488 family)